MLAEIDGLVQLANVKRVEKDLKPLVQHPILILEANFRVLELALFELSGMQGEPPEQSRYELASDRNGWGKSEDIFGCDYPTPQAAIIDWGKDENARNIILSENYNYCGVGFVSLPNPYGLFPHSRYWLMLLVEELNEGRG